MLAILIADAQAEGLTESARYWFRQAATVRMRWTAADARPRRVLSAHRPVTSLLAMTLARGAA